jgi:hypothetical protein
MTNSDFYGSRKASGYNSVYHENDSSSSPEPLSSRLEGSKMMVYETENMQELYMQQINLNKNQYFSGLEGHGIYRHINQVSGDKQTPSERQT